MGFQQPSEIKSAYQQCLDKSIEAGQKKGRPVSGPASMIQKRLLQQPGLFKAYLKGLLVEVEESGWNSREDRLFYGLVGHHSGKLGYHPERDDVRDDGLSELFPGR